MSDIELASKETLNLKGRLYHSKLNQKTLQGLKNSPYFVLVREASLQSNFDNIKSFYHNDLFASLVDYKRNSLGINCHGFEVLNYIYSKNWLSFYSKLLSFIIRYDKTSLSLEKNDLCIISKDFNVEPGNFTVHKQLYEELPGNFVCEIYFVYTTKSYVKLS